MDQDFYNDIEASSMSVDDILREFYAQEEAEAAPTPQRSTAPRRAAPEKAAPSGRTAPAPRRPKASPPKREPRRSAEKRAPLSALSGLHLPWQQTADPEPRPAAPSNTRGASAVTEKPMDFKPEMDKRPADADSGDDRDLLGIFGDLFDRDDGAADVQPEAPAEPAADAGSAGDDGLSLDAILSEYGRIFAEAPAEAMEEPEPAETEFFTPKKKAPRPEEKASAQDYAAYAAGTSAVASSREKISALSSMAEEAMRYMDSLTGEDYDRMESSPAPKAAPSRKDAGAERFNLSGHESKMVFGDKELDLSPDESYVPPVQNSEPIYHWTAGEEDLPDAPEEKPGLLQRIMSFNGSRRKEAKRPLNAPARRARSKYKTTVAEEEKPADTPAAEAPAEAAAEAAAEAPATAAPAEDTVLFEGVKTEKPAEKRPAPAESDFSFSFDDTLIAPAAYAPDEDYTPEAHEEDAGEETGATDPFFAESEAEDAPEETEASDDAPDKEAPEGVLGGLLRKRKARHAKIPAAEEEIPLDENGEFPSFTQYVWSLVTGTLFRLRGAGGAPSSATMETEGEDLGPELTPAAASKYYGSHVPSLRIRFRMGLALLAVLAWISLGFPVSGMLRTVRVAAGMCLGLQLTIMLLNLDVITNAAINLVRLRFGADSLAVLTCVLTSFDALAVALDAFGTPHVPLCLISSLSLMGVLYSSYLSARGLRKALRVPSIGKRCSTVSGENALKGKGITLLKTERPLTGFVRRTEEAAPDEIAFLRAAPALLILCFLLAAIVSAARHAGGDFLYIFTALLAPAVPVSALLCFALPFFIGSNRIFSVGAAIAGWSGLGDVGRSQNLIITDRDLFPEGSVEIDTVRIFADADPERILSYAGTMILASGSGIAPCFAELMNRNGGTMRHVENFELLPGGGMKGTIDGSTVLCGGTELMRLMNVRIPYRLVDKTTVLLAVDSVLYGIFNLKYTGQLQVRKALVGLIRSSRHPVFAIRDFNVNPEMLREIFDVATDGYDFPPYLERFKLSEAPEDSETPVAAVVCREGLGPLSLMADTGRSMYLATRFNLIVTLIAAIVSVIVVFVRFLSVGSAGPGFLLLLAILWALPVAAASLFLKI